MLEKQSSIISGRSRQMAESARLAIARLHRASGLLIGPSVKFDMLSDPWKSSQSLIIWLYKLELQACLLCLENKHAKFSNVTSVGKNLNF